MILIVCGGRRPSFEFLNEYIKKASYIIAADSGADVLLENNITPNLLVGDFDSIEEKEINNIESDLSKNADSMNKNLKLIRYKTQKDFTDSKASLDEALKLPDEEIIMMGAIGTRLDHSLSNLSLFKDALIHGRKLVIIDENNIVEVINKPKEVRKMRKYISFYAYNKEVSNFSLKGFKYPLSNYTLKIFDFLTVSNEIEGERGFVSFKEGDEVLVIQSND